MIGAKEKLTGFHAVNAHSIDHMFADNRPAHGGIPAACISMIGVDRRFQEHGHDGDPLVDCLTRLALQTGYAFTPLQCNNLQLVLPVATVRALIAQPDP